MTKETAKDIAIALIAKHGMNFEMTAFEDCEDLPHADQCKIIHEIQMYCIGIIAKLNDKYDIDLHLTNTTESVTNAIIFE